MSNLEMLFFGLAIFWFGWQIGQVYTGFVIANRLRAKVTVGLTPTLLAIVFLVAGLLV